MKDIIKSILLEHMRLDGWIDYDSRHETIQRLQFVLYKVRGIEETCNDEEISAFYSAALSEIVREYPVKMHYEMVFGKSFNAWYLL